MTKKRASTPLGDPGVSSNNWSPKPTRRTIAPAIIFLLYLFDMSSRFPRLYAYEQHLEVVPLILEPQQTDDNQQTIAIVALDEHQDQLMQQLDLSPLKAEIALPNDESIIGETRFYNFSLPKNHSKIIEKIFDLKPRPPEKTNKSESNVKFLDKSAKLSFAESKRNIAIAFKKTTPSENSEENKNESNERRTSRQRKLSATKLKNLNFLPLSNNTTNATGHLFLVNNRNPSEVKLDITKRLDLVADSTSPATTKTMVLVTTKSKKFSELVPLDELIVTPTNIHHGLNLVRPLLTQANKGSAPPNYMIKDTPLTLSRSEEGTHADDDDDGSDDDDHTPSYELERQKSLAPLPYQQTPTPVAMDRRMGLASSPRNMENKSYIRNTRQDLNVAAGHYYKKKKPKHKKKPKKKKKHHHDHGKYYMYAKVPKKKAWEFGYKRGDKKHKIERHEKGHKSHFKTKVKWEDKKSKGKGIHIWDYNHHDKKKKKHY